MSALRCCDRRSGSCSGWPTRILHGNAPHLPVSNVPNTMVPPTDPPSFTHPSCSQLLTMRHLRCPSTCLVHRTEERGWAGHSTAPHGTAQRRGDGQGTARHHMARHRGEGMGRAQHGTTWHRTEERGWAGHSTAPHGTAQHSKARQSTAEHLIQHVNVLLPCSISAQLSSAKHAPQCGIDRREEARTFQEREGEEGGREGGRRGRDRLRDYASTLSHKVYTV